MTSKPSDSDTWQTPKYILDCVRKIGPILLDPCTTKENPTSAKYICTEYSELYDGLNTSWSDLCQGNNEGLPVWVNPPFSNFLAWANKTIEETFYKYEIARIGKGGSLKNPLFFLGRSDPSTEWYQRLRTNADCIIHPYKRVIFINPENPESRQAPKFACVIFGFNVTPKRAAWAFQSVADVIAL